MVIRSSPGLPPSLHALPYGFLEAGHCIGLTLPRQFSSELPVYIPRKSVRIRCFNSISSHNNPPQHQALNSSSITFGSFINHRYLFQANTIPSTFQTTQTPTMAGDHRSSHHHHSSSHHGSSSGGGKKGEKSSRRTYKLETMWNCCQCDLGGAGPQAMWNNLCPNCPHQRCTYCGTTQVKIYDNR